MYGAILEIQMRDVGAKLLKVEEYADDHLVWLKGQEVDAKMEDLFHWFAISGDECYVFDAENTIFGMANTKAGAVNAALHHYAATLINTGADLSKLD